MKIIIRGTPEEIASFVSELTSPTTSTVSYDDLEAVSQAICDRLRGGEGGRIT